ncbi:hypothetical protein [Candidatus Macondimonas diazotrophica]|uniref:Head fiber protein n=1 Tax=Candidatus Macondimonas diazotrophica TaxID=2305248 RepID=A0A4Z0F6W1_9GAMM|nr:hypothetical protein [Candidatus Macondimonas diazotrophica]TFZ81696.1 hypothetical protein E4680_11540 [Candidatus Macondimonas diazotrophica]
MAIVKKVQVVAEDTVAGVVGLPSYAPLQSGLVQADAITDAAVPFADLTAAATKVNEILAALRTAGVIASA